MSDIQIVQFDPDSGLASLGMSASPKKLDGAAKLTQIVILAYLKNPGQDVFDPNEGSGLRAAIGQYNFVDGSEVKSLFIQRTQAIEKEIINRQDSASGVPEERLKKLTVLDVAFESASNRLLGRVQIVNEAGGTTDILV